MAGRAWLNEAGGLRYHARAFAAGKLWAPFRKALAKWLTSFELSEQVILVGPSAAHCLPDAFFRRFTRVIALEPDPIAGFLLRRRFVRLELAEPRIERTDLLLRPLVDGRAGLAELMAQERNASVVFCNVLGQTHFLLPDAEFTHFKAGFSERILPALAGRGWLSFHDRFSSELAPSFSAPLPTSARLSDEAVLRELYGSAERRGELLDHDTTGLFPTTLPHAYFDWEISRGFHHLIEGVGESRKP